MITLIDERLENRLEFKYLEMMSGSDGDVKAGAEYRPTQGRRMGGAASGW